MRAVWPDVTGDLDREALLEYYAYPEDLDRPWVRVNFVASADGAVSVGGVSTGLHAPGDAEVFGALRELADVVLVGAGSARAEHYRGVRTSPEKVRRRRDRGLADVPPVAVVTTGADLDPDAALFTDTAVAPLVFTAAGGDRLVAAGAEVVTATGPAAVLAALEARGLRRVLCEGGPALFGSLLAAGLVDELCLSLAPQLAGPAAGRIVAGPALDGPRPLTLRSVITHDGGLMVRYVTSPFG